MDLPATEEGFLPFMVTEPFKVAAVSELVGFSCKQGDRGEMR